MLPEVIGENTKQFLGEEQIRPGGGSRGAD